jgi:uncharacterized BrkB/YihY/UPF0761 family membrane protein
LIVGLSNLPAIAKALLGAAFFFLLSLLPMVVLKTVLLPKLSDLKLDFKGLEVEFMSSRVPQLDLESH